MSRWTRMPRQRTTKFSQSRACVGSRAGKDVGKNLKADDEARSGSPRQRDDPVKVFTSGSLENQRRLSLSCGAREHCGWMLRTEFVPIGGDLLNTAPFSSDFGDGSVFSLATGGNFQYRPRIWGWQIREKLFAR